LSREFVTQRTDRWAKRMVLKRRWGKRHMTKEQGREKGGTTMQVKEQI
jgi:hypothetical protein